MKSVVTHFICAMAGFVAAALLFMFVSSLSSLVWQNDIKIRTAYSLQQDGAKAAEKEDWLRAATLFRASKNIESSIQPIRWDMSYPLHGWRLAGLVQHPDQTFSFPDLCVEAYALRKQGKTDEARLIYAELEKSHPTQSQDDFDAIAEKTLSALRGTSPPG